MDRPSTKIDVDTQDNSLATATLAAPGSAGCSNYVTSVSGGYTGTVSGNTLVLKDGTTEVARWLVYDSLTITFDSPIVIEGAANLELAASGAGGNSGSAVITGYAK